MAVSPERFVEASDDFLAKMEASKLVSANELEAVRKELVRDIKREARGTVKGLQTAQVGASRVLVPNSENLKKINLSTERVRNRMSSFRLNYLDRDQVKLLTEDGTMNDDPKKFIRHSRRLARHSREFLNRIKELEPELEEEVDIALQQIEDNDMDLLKLEVKSFTRIKETMLRGVNGRKQRGEVLREIEDFDIDRGLFNLSLLEHPDATVRSIFANASERMAEASTLKTKVTAKRAHVFVGLPPGKAARMTPASRTADIAWRVFDQKSINEKFAALPPIQGSKSSWRGLGLGYNTGEFYVPVPPSVVEGLAAIATNKRAQAIALAEANLLAKQAAQISKEEARAAEAREAAVLKKEADEEAAKAKEKQDE